MGGNQIRGRPNKQGRSVFGRGLGAAADGWSLLGNHSIGEKKHIMRYVENSYFHIQIKARTASLFVEIEKKNDEIQLLYDFPAINVIFSSWFPEP